jgi:hypothetical protein
MLDISATTHRVKRLSKPRHNKQISVITDDETLEYASELDGTRIEPVSRYAYIDTLVFLWPRGGLSQAEYECLKRNQPRHSVEWRSWRREYEVLLFYPISDEVIVFMIELMQRYPGLQHRRSHVALDWCFNSEAEKEQARRIFETYNICPWCRVFPFHYKGTTYSKKNKHKPSNRATYDDKKCRVTGEAHCLHIEARFKGREALERNGVDIESLKGPGPAHILAKAAEDGKGRCANDGTNVRQQGERRKQKKVKTQVQWDICL